MKALKIVIILLMISTTSLIAHNKHRDGYSNHHKHSKYIKRKHFKRYGHFVKVRKSKPIYREVTRYSDYSNNHDEVIVGGVVGGIIGNSIGDDDASTIVGSLIGAVVGLELSHKHKRRRYTEKELVGYKNIAFYRGERIVEVADRPLRRIWVNGRNYRH